jgi:hypothetical protein
MSDEESPRSNEDSDINSSPVTSNTCPPTAQQKDISQALFKVPEGFQALLKHLTRELLNAKPKDPYVYIADFLKTKVNDKRNGERRLKRIFRMVPISSKPVQKPGNFNLILTESFTIAGLLEQEFFNDDNLNIDIKPPMHYLQQTSLTNVTCPSTTVFGTMASEPAAALQASYDGNNKILSN